ncbi:hypothetical protein PtA15_4A356, partial [Puccinia triticina]
EGDTTSGSVTNHTFPSRKKLVNRVAKGKAPFKPDVTIWCSDNDLVALATREMNPQTQAEQIISHEREKIRSYFRSSQPLSI